MAEPTKTPLPQPKQPVIQPPTRLAAPSASRAAREGRSPGVAGDALANVAPADDAFPPLLAVVATAGGIGLLAAALGLFVLGGVKRRAGGGAIAARETCETAISRIDGDGDFYAQAVGPDGKSYVAARSVMFRWNGSDSVPDNAAVHAAYDVLLQRLAWDGWEVEDALEATWWKSSFSRPVEAAAEVAAD